MARIIPFRNKRGTGLMIANLPMPDGSKRTYREPASRFTIRLILRRWQIECAEMLNETESVSKCHHRPCSIFGHQGITVKVSGSN